MSRGLQANLGVVRNRITTTLRHLFDLLEDQAVVISGKRRAGREPQNRQKNRSS